MTLHGFDPDRIAHVDGLERTESRAQLFAYDEAKRHIVRTVILPSGDRHDSPIPVPRVPRGRLAAAYDLAWLRSQSPPLGVVTDRVRFADLFSGAGIMSVGFMEACRAVGFSGDPVFAIDFSPANSRVYRGNFSCPNVESAPIESLIDSQIGCSTSNAEKKLQEKLGEIEWVLAGPPCQGHSDLNNHTRRSDPKNELLLKIVRFAELFSPKHVIIENVRGLLHDKGHVVERATAAFERIGYNTTSLILKAEQFGVPQKRRRVFLIASIAPLEGLDEFLRTLHVLPRTFGWACRDLLHVRPQAGPMDQASAMSDANKRRVRHLFKRDVYNLPDRMRPACHRDKVHSYNSVYGRLRWNEPSQTITTGFGSMGQGRYVHPKRPRVITPHEAARLQFIPDFFSFDGVGRGAMAEMIGNAVPPKLVYAIALYFLRQGR